VLEEAFSQADDHGAWFIYSIQMRSEPEAPVRRPLDGIRVLAIEQMQALPYATQLLARLGADVVKVEPLTGEMGRGSTPAIPDPEGRPVGATFLRNNFNKQSVAIDLKNPAGRELVIKMAPRFQVFAENSRPGTMARLGLSYDDIRAVHPAVVYASVSGFGNQGESPYKSRAAFASIVEAMSGIYDLNQRDDQAPVGSPVGALGDISAALFVSVGILAAIRYLETTGKGQYVDVAMLDAVVAFTDIVINFWSLGVRKGDQGGVINNGFLATDGWFMVQVGREAHFARLANIVSRPDWLEDPRFATRQGWLEQLETEIRPAVEKWAADKTRAEACALLSGEGIVAGPCLRSAEVASDPHLVARNMLSTIQRLDGKQPPVLVPGNPVKLSGVTDSPDYRPPWLGEHTNEVLGPELGLTPLELDDLRRAGAIA
jgi:crotonobetainyl-CoA:carnitine CoA-transferase CaiB-like acyl-CoA transferase